MSLEKYRQKHKKKHYGQYVAMGLAFIGALFLVKYFHGIFDQQTRKALEGNGSLIQRDPMAENTQDQLNAPQETPEMRVSTAQKMIRGGLTAEQWFQKGNALDDESEMEMKCYSQAIALDPRFAPAYYRLGAIYLRRAEFALANQLFVKFLKFASEQDRLIYDIYVYYSPAEVEELLEENVVGYNQDLQTVVKFTSVNGQIRVPVLLNGYLEVNMLLDTGADITLISEELADELGLLSTLTDTRSLLTIAQHVQAPVAELDEIEFGNLIKRNFFVAVADLNLAEEGFEGILGMDFLGDSNIHIDRNHNRIILVHKLNDEL